MDEVREAKALGLTTRPVLLGPVTFLLLSQSAPGSSGGLLSVEPVERRARRLRATAGGSGRRGRRLGATGRAGPRGRPYERRTGGGGDWRTTASAVWPSVHACSSRRTLATWATLFPYWVHRRLRPWGSTWFGAGAIWRVRTSTRSPARRLWRVSFRDATSGGPIRPRRSESCATCATDSATSS